jgi:ABC-type uncharacterized transport system auxiliary subunit
VSRRARLALLALLGACLGGLGRAPPAKQRFMLGAEPPASAAGRAGPGLLRLERVRVSPIFDRKSFVYRLGESRFDTDYYREFFSPPGVLVQEALRNWLAVAGPLRLTERSGPELRWSLEPELEALFADRRDAQNPHAVLRLGVRLLELPGGRVALEKDYSAEERAADTSPDALVAAWDRALAHVLTALVEDLTAAVAAAPPPAAPGGARGSAPPRR